MSTQTSQITLSASAASAASATHTQKLGSLALSSLLLVATLPLAGCPAQSTLAALTSVLGNAAVSIANLEGNSALAAQLQTDTAAATAAIQNWKQGTPAQNVVQALQIVESDLNLIAQIPGAQQYAPLIALALSTVISIIEIVDPGAVPAAMAKVKVAGVSTATTAVAPKTKKEFVARWNQICASNSQLAGATIK